MVSVEQNRLNLRSAEKLVAVEMGLDPDNNALTYEQRAEFTRKLAAKILQYADRFTDATLTTARMIQQTAYDPLADASFSATDFVAAYAEPFADAGKGAAAAISSLRWVLPVAAVAAAVILLVSFSKKTGAVAS